MTAAVLESWWHDQRDVCDTLYALQRAGLIPAAERSYYLAKPWKWTNERQTVQRLEAVMRSCGVDPAEGWGMTLAEIAARKVSE